MLRFLKLLFRTLVINNFGAWILIPLRLRYVLLKVWGAKVFSSNISHSCYFKSNRIRVGKNSFINSNCYFDNDDEVEIGENCAVAMFVKFITSTHEHGDQKQRAGKPICIGIKVEAGVWIGANSTILPGVRIGSGCIIASGAVVTKSCEPNGLYGGVPAKRIRDI